MKKVLLYSGGMDSYIISHLWKPDVKLFIDYGTEQTKMERSKLPDDVIVKEYDLSEYIEPDGINTIPLRNLIFAAIAVNYGDVIAIGGLKDDFHFDKTEKFAEDATEIFNSVLNNEASARNVKVVVPYRHLTKSELLIKYIDEGGSIEDVIFDTWSCHTPVDGVPCGKCVACVKKYKAIEELMEYVKDKE